MDSAAKQVGQEEHLADIIANVDSIRRTCDLIQKTSQSQYLEVCMYLQYLYKRDPNCVPTLKTFVKTLLSNLKTTSQDLDDISSRAQGFENILVCPVPGTQLNEEISLSTPQKIFQANEYENMIKEQLFGQENKNRALDYEEENNAWNVKIRDLNNLFNKCIEYAEKNI